MNRPRKNAPHRRPKHERRTKNTRQTPQSHYTNRARGKHPTTVIFDEMPRRTHKKRREGDDAWMGDTPYLEERNHGFVMPPDEEEPSTAKVTARVLAFVLGGLALMYAITWIYGHFRWGW